MINNYWLYIAKTPEEEAIQTIKKNPEDFIDGLMKDYRQLNGDSSEILIKMVNIISKLERHKMSVTPNFEGKVTKLMQTISIGLGRVGKTVSAQPGMAANSHKVAATFQSVKVKQLCRIIESAFENGQLEMVSGLIRSLSCLQQIEMEFNTRSKSLQQMVIDHQLTSLTYTMVKGFLPENSFLTKVIDSQSLPFIQAIEQEFKEEDDEQTQADKKVFINGLLDAGNILQKSIAAKILANPHAPSSKLVVGIVFYAAYKKGDMPTIQKIKDCFGEEVFVKLLFNKYTYKGVQRPLAYIIRTDGRTHILENFKRFLPEDAKWILKSSAEIGDELTTLNEKSSKLWDMYQDKGAAALIQRFELMDAKDLVQLLSKDFRGLNYFYHFILDTSICQFLEKYLQNSELKLLVLGEDTVKIRYFKRKEKLIQNSNLDSAGYIKYIYTILGENQFVALLREQGGNFPYLQFITKNTSSLKVIKELIDPKSFQSLLSQRNKQGLTCIQYWAKYCDLPPLQFLENTLPIEEFRELLNAIDPHNGNHILHYVAQNPNPINFLQYLTNASGEKPPLVDLEEVFLIKNHFERTPIGAAVNYQNHRLMLHLLKIPQYREITLKQVSFEKREWVLYYRSLFKSNTLFPAEMRSWIVDQLPKEMSFYAAWETKGLVFLFHSVYTQDQGMNFLSDYPFLQTAYEKTITKKQSDALPMDVYEQFVDELMASVGQFTEWTGSNALENAMIVGSDRLLHQLIKELGPDEVQKQLTDLQVKYPLLAEQMEFSLEDLSWITNENHMRLELQARLEVPPEKLVGYSPSGLSLRFNGINFDNPNQPGYRDPARLRNDTPTGYVPVSKETLSASLHLLVHKLIPNREPFVGTPPAGTPDLITFYENLEVQFNELQYHLDQLKDPSANLTEEEQRDNLDILTRTLIDIAVASLHCGSRWQAEAEDAIQTLLGTPESLDDMLQQLMGKLRSDIADELASTRGKDSHTKNTVLIHIGKRMAIPGSNRIVEHLKDPNLTEEDSIIYFTKTYVPRRMRQHLEAKAENNSKIRNALLAWFKDNPGDWGGERFTRLQSTIKEDPEWQNLMQQIRSGNQQTTPFIEAFTIEIKPKIDTNELEGRLALTDEVKAKEPEIYAKELEGLVRKAFPEVSLIDLKKFVALLSLDEELQKAFHGLLLASLPRYRSKYPIAQQEFIAQLQRLENASKIQRYLTGQGVTVVRGMANRLATQANYQEILANMLERQRGEEFIGTVYGSLGATLLDKMLESEHEKLAEFAEAEEVIAWLKSIWKDAFGDAHEKEWKLLSKEIKNENFSLINPILDAVLEPTTENQVKGKQALMRLPGFGYQFDQSELMRLLEEKGYIKR